MKRYLLFILSILFTPLFLLSQPFDNELNIFFDQMKTTENVATEIITTGADFNKSLLSDPSDYAQYTSDTIKLATYLGVYLSDLNYCLVYGQSNPARKLFSSAIELSKDLGVDKNALQFLMTRYDENKSQNDSLMNVVKQLFEK